MIDISATSNAASNQAAAQATSAKSKVSSDFQTFLTMLTAQMQNQDPMNPIESGDYAVQLATFSGVEQQVQTNDLLKAMSAGFKADGLQALSGWIGREAPAVGAVHFDGTPKTLEINADPKATRVAIEVVDANDQVVQRFDVPRSDKKYEWDGLTTTGAPLPTGSYSFRTTSWEGTLPLGQEPTPVFQRIVEVRANADGGTLVFEGGGTAKANDISTIREAT